MKGQFKLGTAEIDQIAYPLAKRLKLPTRVIRLRTVKTNGRTALLEALDQFARRTVAGVVEVQKKQSIFEMYRFINSKVELAKNAAIYTEYVTQIGWGPPILGLIWSLIGIAQSTYLYQHSTGDLSG